MEEHKRKQGRPSVIVDGKKKCLECEKILELSQFYKGGAGPNSYRSKCKRCESEIWAKRYKDKQKGPRRAGRPPKHRDPIDSPPSSGNV